MRCGALYREHCTVSLADLACRPCMTPEVSLPCVNRMLSNRGLHARIADKQLSWVDYCLAPLNPRDFHVNCRGVSSIHSAVSLHASATVLWQLYSVWHDHQQTELSGKMRSLSDEWHCVSHRRRHHDCSRQLVVVLCFGDRCGRLRSITFGALIVGAKITVYTFNCSAVNNSHWCFCGIIHGWFSQRATFACFEQRC